MFKFVILFSAIAALALSAVVRVTPDELKTQFETVESEVRELEEAAQESIRAAEESLHEIADEAKQQYNATIEADNAAFYTAVEELLADNEGDEEIERCVRMLYMELERIEEESLSASLAEAEESIHQAEESLFNATRQLEELRREVEECADETCAGTLSTEITELEATIKSAITAAVAAAEAAASSVDGSDISFDETSYKTAVAELVTQVAECANGDEPEPPK